MRHNTLGRAILIGCCGTALLSAGCSRWIEMMSAPHDGVVTRSIAKHDQVPLVLNSMRLTRNGAPQNPSADTEARILGTLQELGLFSHLSHATSETAPTTDKIVRARLSFDEAVDPHAGAAAWKGIVIGASMFILAPVLPLEYDYAAHVTLELERWDGQIKRYESQSAGTAHYHLFGATPIMLDELKGHVTESCLTALAEQLVQDTAFYAASSAPVSTSTVRTVSVKPRTPSAPSSLSAIPVKTSTEP